jgi:hypothetical protein
MKKILLSFITSFLMLTLMGCQENPVEQGKVLENLQAESFLYESLSLEEINQLIIGKWKWTHSIIMQRNIHPPDNLITPEKAGYTMQHDFKSNGKFDVYLNEKLIRTYSYEIKRFKVLPDDKGSITEIFIDGNPFQLLFSHPDSMMIGIGWLDGIDEYFSRE